MSIYDFYRWYREGTVAVTNGSPNVVGTGTNWVTGATKIRPGDIFTTDGDRFYEVHLVVDDTHITLAANFAGTTGAARPYSIIRNFSATPGAELVAKQITLIDRSLQREKQFIDWQSLPASVDPMTPTTITFTRFDGGPPTVVKSLAQIQDDIDRAIAAGNVGPEGPEGPEGPPGPGLVWKGAWTVSAVYAAADGVSVENGGAWQTYICTVPHTALASNRPGSGANWAAVWKIFLENNPGPQGVQGVQGIQGIQGVPGVNGRNWLSGIANPSGPEGVNGDYFLNTVTGAFFEKMSGNWVARGNLKGPAGANGASVVWLTSAWNTYPNFAVNNALRHGPTAYICRVAHTRASDNEPGVGANWQTYWSVMAQGLSGTSGLPAGGTTGNILLKLSSADGHAGWSTTLPANAVNLVDQVWTGTSLTNLASRPYSALTGRPTDDNWRQKTNFTAAYVAGELSEREPYFPVIVHSIPDPLDDQWGYGKMSFAEWSAVVKLALGAPLGSMAFQENSNVDITGGTANLSSLNAVWLRANVLDMSVGLNWYEHLADGVALFDPTLNSRICVDLSANMTLQLPFPSQLGRTYANSGRIIFKNLVAGKTVTLPPADLVIGTQPTDVNAVYILAWEYVQKGELFNPTPPRRTIFSWIY